MKQPGWRQGIGAAVLLAGVGTACGQSVDTSMARAVVDQPLSMSVQVRGFDWPASRLTPDCLQVQIQQGESGDTIAPVRVRTLPSGNDGRVLVQISSPQRVTDTVLAGRLSLLCGADYTREFTVLVDPPAAGGAQRRRAPSAATQPSLEKHPDKPPLAPATPAPLPALSTPPATARALDEAELQRLVNAVVTAMTLTMASAAAPPAPAPESPASTLPWQDLHEEQRQTRASLAALVARIERSERDTWRDAVLVMAAVIGLSVCMLVWRLIREGMMPRMGTTEPATAHRLRRQRVQSRPETSDPCTPQPPADGASAPTPTGPDPGLVAWSAPPATPPNPNRWPDADFGHPNLDTTNASAQLLDELEPHVEESPIGVAVVLERRLQELPGKCPWILLRLLDLYRQMAQPWNHERVAAQLEALYNVRIPAMDPAAMPTDAALEAYPETLDRILHAWPLDDPAAALSCLLLRPTAIEVLDQPAFEDVLLLHGIVRQRQSAWLTAVEGGGSGSTMAARPPQAVGSRLMELLAA
ncbi:hypothetical protein [uncultured Sphaerotilus sp.]|uniref:hypothetical protein n=1 Tax=uncultured Sphaerotilus sp. TaxID=474984 RepID=UPI0030CA420F